VSDSLCQMNAQSEARTIRIGGGSAGFGDGLMAAPRLVADGALDYLMFDFLSEYYMPMAGRARSKDAAAGFVDDFPEGVFASILGDALDKGVKLVANAGAVNPAACVEALRAVAARLGRSPVIAVVTGDDLLDRAADLRAAGLLTQELPAGASYTGVNAYVGAFPIARALAMGADVVITGRVVDSALALGPLIHEFGWSVDDFDLLAAGSLVGHLLECGAQASGGLFTDWHEIEDYSDIGYPIAAVRADGTAVITKPPGTGGRVSVGSVAEQLLYEIADPATYPLPDVTCDFTGVRIDPVAEDEVLVSGARGRAPGADLKGIATWDDGWMVAYGFIMRGPEAEQKARAVIGSVLRRTERMLEAREMPPFRRHRIDVFGDDGSYGAQAQPRGAREVVCRVALEHVDPRAFGVLLREHGTASVSMAPGITGWSFRSVPQPIARSESFFVPGDEVPVTVTVGERVETVRRASRVSAPSPAPAPVAFPAMEVEPDREVRLHDLAWVRSGDKGDACNIGVIARRPEYLPYLAAALGEDAVHRWYSHWLDADRGDVRRYHLPGVSAVNLVLDGALDGGCTVSLRFDPFGKSAAQEILDFPVPIPSGLTA
jgi:hypothetical protein